MSNFNLSKRGKVTRVIDAIVAGTSGQNGTTIDMKGFDSVLFITSFGVITTNAVTSVNLATSSDDSNWNDLIGSKIVVADDDDTSVTVHDVNAPLERYIRVEVARATQNAVIDGCVCIQYNAQASPTTHDATTVIGAEFYASPAEGTA